MSVAETSNLVAILLMIFLCGIAYALGRMERSQEFIDVLRWCMKKNEKAAIEADAHMMDDRSLHRPSYDIGYFNGRDDAINEIFDRLEKKGGKERDRRTKKQNR